jgi:hypothetical protein
MVPFVRTFKVQTGKYLTSSMQLEITALSYGRGPRIEASMDESGGNLAPPTEEEQESMARFWAMEEANIPKGWGDDQEIDYAEISSKRKAADVDESRNSG